MPVWHQAARKWREEKGLVVLGLAQEQHPARCALYQQWQEFDWPILWDPFNLSNSKVVPRFIEIDAGGIVRSLRANPRDFAAEFLDREFPLPASVSSPPAPASAPTAVTASPTATLSPSKSRAAIQDFLDGQRALEELIPVLERAAAAYPDDASLQFRWGVALRMRFDSGPGHPDDFQGAVDAWRRALAMRPDQYIWRRRIQQFGPRMDKPYPFYPWVGEARAAIRARGRTPVSLPVPLTAAERAQPERALTVEPGGNPPAEDQGVPVDDRGLIRVRPTVVFGTGRQASVARVYLDLRPSKEARAVWDNALEPLRVELDPSSLPPGARLERRRLVHPNPAAETSSELRRLEFEIRLPDGVRAARLRAYVMAAVCELRDGSCTWLRHPFTLNLQHP